MFGGFGAASSAAFGATSPSPFGQQTPAFGQTASPFGATATTGVFGQSQPAFGASPAPAFGASPTPAFGAASTPAFGAASAPAFGAAPGSAFGAKPAFGGFGASAASPFGATSAPAFGATSAPAFGAAASAPAFGASPFGGATSTFGASAPAFGAASAPAFGAASAPAFGQSLTAFGSTTFGASQPAAGGFGTAGFGGGTRGTRAVAWRKTQEQDTSGSGSGAKTVVFFNSISCMPEFAGKSVEELRWEDYQDGCKGNTGAASPAGGAFGAATFGAPAAGSPFGAPASSPAFGAASSPAFGASAPAFGAASAPAFGAFGATSAPAFGAAASAPAFGGFGAASAPFGATSPSPFGQSAPAFGATSTPAFGATSTPAFGASSAPAFGAPSSTPAFGGFGASSAPAFGATPGFGAASSPGFGFGATSAPAFGATSAPAFGAASTPAFGFGASSTPAFGAASAPAFGASSASLFGATSAPAFGGTSLFGATQQKPATGFGFGAASTPAFGAAPTPAFGASGASLFGASSAPAFGAGTSLFGASQATPSFSFAPAQPAAAAAAGGALAPAQPVQAPGVATSPYGVLPEAPKVAAVPEYKVGLTQRPAGLLAGGPPRPAALITPRSITPRSGVRMRPRRSMSATRMSKSPADFLAVAAQAAGTPGADGRGASTTPNGTSIFVPRENPRRLFVREPLPSTEAAGTTTASPALGGTPGRPPLRTPGSGLRITPGRRTDGGSGENGGYSGENGFGGFAGQHGSGGLDSLAGIGSGGVELSDVQLSAVLPSLKQPEYYTEPSLQQLAAMARDDPASLASVSNFCVGRRGVGSVRWLEPTDVRGLDLDATVQLSKGSIQVYLDESLKPEVGRGLNKPAEVTMLKVFKMDKATGKPTTDQEAIDRFVRKLKRVSADQSARFVSYDATSGTWKFEVEHFSRYGLLDSDDEDEDSDEEALQQFGVRRAGGGSAAAQQRQQQGGGTAADGEGAEEQQEEAEDGVAMQDSEGQAGDDDEMAGRRGEGEDDGEVQQQELSFGMAPDGGADGGDARALQVSLPAQLGMDPEDLLRIREGLYAGTQQARQPPTKQRRLLVVGAGGRGSQAQDAAAGPAAAAAAPAALGAGQARPTVARPPLAARNAWRQQQASALQPPAASSAPRTPPQPGPPLLPAGRTPVVGSLALLPASQQCLVPAPGTASQPGNARCLPDAGLFAGASFRVGWAPNAVVAHTGGSAASAGHVVMRQLAAGARVAPPGEPAGRDSAFQRRQRKALLAALKLHKLWSQPDAESAAAATAAAAADGDADMADGGQAAVEAAEAGGVSVPRWRLRCRREQELRQLTLQQIQLCQAAAAEVPEGQAGGERSVHRHQASTWELLHVLFSAIEGDPRSQQLAAAADSGGSDGGGSGKGKGGKNGKDGQGGPADMADDDGEDGDDEVDEDMKLDRLAAFKRRAQLSHWLRDRARPLVEASLRNSAGRGGAAATSASDAVAAQLLVLLSGHQLAAAAGLAAATGNVRLATLLAQAGTKALGQAELAEQLLVWEESGCERHISEALRRVYRLLAGQVDAVTPAMQLDWRRALGVHLWYGCQPTATVTEALASYTSAVEAGAAPPPRPMYAEQQAAASSSGAGSSGSGSGGSSAFDVAFELLRLHAVDADPEAAAAPASTLQPLLKRLLRPSGWTPDPLDYSFCWHLLEVLAAVGALSQDAANLPEAAATRMSFISQLEMVGGLPQWAVYAALHIPDAEERSRVVRELLMVHAGEWGADPEAAAFLRDELRLPAAWLAEAQALWAQHRNDDAGRLRQLLEAGDWPAAHTLLCSAVAPRWLLTGQVRELRAVLDDLERHAAEVNAAGGVNAWESGGGVYQAFLYLKDLYASLAAPGQHQREPPTLSYQERLNAAGILAHRLQEAAVRWGLAAPNPQQQAARLDARPDGGAAQQAVYSRMSAELSRWVMSDSEGPANLLPTPNQSRLAVGMRVMPQAEGAAVLQMAAVNLAQRVA